MSVVYLVVPDDDGVRGEYGNQDPVPVAGDAEGPGRVNLRQPAHTGPPDTVVHTYSTDTEVHT